MLRQLPRTPRFAWCQADCFTFLQSQRTELLGRHLRFYGVGVARLRGLHPREFEPCNRPHHNSARQPRRDARGTRRVTLHVEVVRAHIGQGFGVPRRMVFGRVDTDAVVVGADLHLAFVGAAMEQVDVAQEAIADGDP